LTVRVVVEETNKASRARGRGRLRAVRAGFTRAMTRDRKRLLVHAARTALAASICWWLAARFGLHDGYWGAISAIIVMQSNVGATIQAARDRVLGTIIGAILGFACTLFGTIPWNYILAVFAAVVVCGLLGFRNSSRLAGVTVTIVMLVQSNSPRTVAFDRVVQVLLGILVAVAVTILVLPRHASAPGEDTSSKTGPAEAQQDEHSE
jgi:uncharacterized membrane protein YccC